MTSRKSAGEELVASLTAGLAEGVEWDEREVHLLAQIAAVTDRNTMLGELFEAEMAKPERSTRRITEVAGEIRQGEMSVARMMALLTPDPDTRVKSARHQAAANARWRGAS
ncbi:hypothetical protein ACLQ3K_16105 [Tsukamurella sp. DT100]|uniref:hypothetical protein n=1 Tax=Tsukamurella sp. DT100 TaxID=3393415 RepID=UPI003CEBF5D7